jgi:hypothetical protein
MAHVLNAALSFMKTKIITSDNDKIGIILYGSKTQNNSLSIPSVNIILKLDTPDANTIKFIQDAILNYRHEFGCMERNP